MTTRLVIMISIALAGILAGTQVWLSHLRLELAQETQQTQTSLADLKSEMQTLGLEYASLTRPERLRQLAHKQLGMRPPHPTQVLRP